MEIFTIDVFQRDKTLYGHSSTPHIDYFFVDSLKSNIITPWGGGGIGSRSSLKICLQ